jgi:hypothetical protein
MSNKKPSSNSELTVVLIGVAAMLLTAFLYVWLGFAPDVAPSE